MIETLTVVQEVVYWVASACMVAGVIAMWAPSGFARHSRSLLVIGVVSMFISVVVRWTVTGHPPIFGTFENSIAAAWSIAVAVLWGRKWGPLHDVPDDFERWFSLWIPVALLFGLFFSRTPYPLTISERSFIIDVHVLFAWAAHTVLLAASTAAALIVARRPGWDSAAADSVVVRGAGLGFALFTVMIAVGSLYSYLLFADWFKWEMVEAFAAAAWLGYSSVLHAFMFFRWRGSRLAWAMLIVMPLMLGTFWVWSIYSGTYHNFDIPEIRAS